jgi:hypothetical protein
MTQATSDAWLERTDARSLDAKIMRPLQTLLHALDHVEVQYAIAESQLHRLRGQRGDIERLQADRDAYNYASNILTFSIRRLEYASADK